MYAQGGWSPEIFVKVKRWGVTAYRHRAQPTKCPVCGMSMVLNSLPTHLFRHGLGTRKRSDFFAEAKKKALLSQQARGP